MSTEINLGNKLTEIGVIPEDWSVIPLRELTTEIGDGIHSTPIYSRKSEYSFINGNNLQDGRIIIFDDTKSVSYPEFKRHSKNLSDNSILMSINGTIGNLGLYSGEPIILGKSAAYLNLKNDYSRLFVYYALQSDCVKTQFSDGLTGTTIKNLGLGTIRNTGIPLPASLIERRAIATVLSDMDALISGIDLLIAKKRDIKLATTQQLLSGQQRLPGFSGEWEMKRLGEFGFFLKGSGVTRDQSLSGNLPCIRYGEIYTAHNDYIREFKSYVSVAVAEAATLIKCGDILFACSGETKEDIGKCVSFVDNMEAYAGGDIVIFRPKNVDSLFLGYALNTPVISRQKASRGQGDAVVHISANALASVEVLMPNQAEQSAIAIILADMDTELSALEIRRNKARELKQGMMQELLTGRIRLSQSSQEEKLC
jgi:type I restriction enzyme S subunit